MVSFRVASVREGVCEVFHCASFRNIVHRIEAQWEQADYLQTILGNDPSRPFFQNGRLHSTILFEEGIRMPIYRIFLVCSLCVLATASFVPKGWGATAYVWADRPEARRYEPSSTYTFNPGGRVEIERRSKGNYSVKFENFGAQASGQPGSGGHIQVSSYGTPDRCNADRWMYRERNLTVDVRCHNGGRRNSPVDARFSILAVFESSFVMKRMDVSDRDIELLQVEISRLQSVLADLQQRIEVLETP